ncbi:MAG TPA: sigma factor-like helix-turn-helix DNA-binding protein [Thermoanaerobaculia bacterium]|nr:sigma factor-like helix-turn-helix DNA-binding protein [Thermoanaerobaculia bacterium]
MTRSMQKSVRPCAAHSRNPEPQRIALELAYFEGLSQSEIATRLSQPLGTIKTRMQLGMKKMRERLAPFA